MGSRKEQKYFPQVSHCQGQAHEVIQETGPHGASTHTGRKCVMVKPAHTALYTLATHLAKRGCRLSATLKQTFPVRMGI